jgi:hypothetical protein
MVLLDEHIEPNHDNNPPAGTHPYPYQLRWAAEGLAERVAEGLAEKVSS